MTRSTTRDRRIRIRGTRRNRAPAFCAAVPGPISAQAASAQRSGSTSTLTSGTSTWVSELRFKAPLFRGVENPALPLRKPPSRLDEPTQVDFLILQRRLPQIGLKPPILATLTIM